MKEMNELDDLEDDYIDGDQISIQWTENIKLNDTRSSNSSGNNHIEGNLIIKTDVFINK